MIPSSLPPATLQDLLQRKLIFVSGKGGVGKTAVSQALAIHFSKGGNRTLWICFEDPLQPPGEITRVAPSLWHLNCDAQAAFEEYASLKIGVPGLARLFLRNALMQYLAKAAPGIHEILLMGKVSYETRNYDRVVVDMPSTGYGLAMFNSVKNYVRLFQGGPIQRDAERMLATFADPSFSGHLIVALPEEMPIAESLELYDHMLGFFPENPSAFLINKIFPKVISSLPKNPDEWKSPVPVSAEDYSRRRPLVEDRNLRVLDEKAIPYARFDLSIQPDVAAHLAQQIGEWK